MKQLPLKKQIEMMKIDFPFVKKITNYEFQVIFPDYPLYRYKIHLNEDYPISKPVITRDDEPFKLPVITYWLQTCSLSNIVQNLYLVSMSNSNNSLIPPPSLSPPVKKTVPPIISYEEDDKKNKSTTLSLSKPVCESVFDEDDEVSEISFENPNDSLLIQTGNEYTDSINALKLKFRKKEISFNEFMVEFKRLKSLKNTQNI